MASIEKVTCLSEERHDGNIRDHLLHFFGCVEYSERYSYLNDDSYVLWKRECQRLKKLGLDLAQAQELSQKKRAECAAECRRALRRVDFLRQQLLNDQDQTHYVKCVEESLKSWKKSSEYQANIEHVRNWRASQGKATGRRPYYDPPFEFANTAYESEWDVRVSLMRFQDSKPRDYIHEDVTASFPHQQCTVRSLVHQAVKGENILKREADQDSIQFFHLPSNNMIKLVTLKLNRPVLTIYQQVISKYFGELDPIQNVNEQQPQRQVTEASWILHKRNWRGLINNSPLDSKFLDPFCEDVTYKSGDSNQAPKHTALFMPYLHWETSRNHRTFNSVIEEVSYKYRLDKSSREDSAKLKRQNNRKQLKRANNILKPPKKAHPEAESQLKLGSLREEPKITRKILTLGQLMQAMGFPRNYIPLDRNGRLSLRSRLGQYLLDAARLFQAINCYQDKRMLEKYLVSDPPLNPRRTLDQNFHWTMNTTTLRDRDQVIYRGTTAYPWSFHEYLPDESRWRNHEDLPDNSVCSTCTENIRKTSRIAMVDQLWLWVLDSKTIITCFPSRYGIFNYDSSDISRQVKKRLEDGYAVKSAYDIALIVFEECSGFVFNSVADERPQTITTFSAAIGRIINRHAVLFERLWRWTEEARRMSRRGEESNVVAALFNFDQEATLQREVQDIIDEIRMIMEITRTQKRLLQKFIIFAQAALDPSGEYRRRYHHANSIIESTTKYNGTTYTSKPEEESSSKANKGYETFHWFVSNAAKLVDRIESRFQKIQELEKTAQNTAEDLDDLLELKQYQLGVVQSWQNAAQSEQGMRQGRSVFIFTVVTIVFLPLSFMSSLFGMNAVEFSEGNNMSLQEQFRYIFSISAGVVAITVYLSLSESAYSFGLWCHAILWSIYRRVITFIIVRTGLYKVYRSNSLTASSIYRDTNVRIEMMKAAAIERMINKKRAEIERRASEQEEVREREQKKWQESIV